MNRLTYPAGATPLTPEEQDGLKLKHVTTRTELDRWEQENIQEALAWINRRRERQILTENFLCRLHEKMFNKVWKWAGQIRKSEKSIGIEWIKIHVELKILLDDVKFWIDNRTYEADEIGFRFHHRLVQIHPFPNGNGRHARLITDMLMTETLLKDAFTWGGGNLMQPGSVRSKYIQALKAADQQNYELLRQFVRS
jgi:Fic-DOC domain mobile mystery protein B